MKNIMNKTAFPFFALGLFSHASDILDCPLDKADFNEFNDKHGILMK
ncbi:hypothetical protein R84B8_01494 [Treponema sp. R8-4-B8]